MISLNSLLFTTRVTILCRMCMVFVSLLTFVIMVMGVHATANAQINRLDIGDRVRVTAPFVDPGERIKGTISEMSGSVLVLSDRDSLIYISDSLIQTLEISTGKKRVIGRGLLIGAVTGAIVMGTIAAARNDACGPSEVGCASAPSNGKAFISGGRIGLLGGIATGAIAGLFIKIDRWEKAPVRASLGVKRNRSRFINQRAMEPAISFKILLGD